MVLLAFEIPQNAWTGYGYLYNICYKLDSETDFYASCPKMKI